MVSEFAEVPDYGTVAIKSLKSFYQHKDYIHMPISEIKRENSKILEPIVGWEGGFEKFSTSV